MKSGLESSESARLQEDGEENPDKSERSMTSRPPSLTPYMYPLPFPHTRKTDEHETVALGERCSVAIQNKLLAKLKDPGSFSIPCLLGNVCIDRALCDVGFSVSLMPLSLCEKLNLGEMRPTTISLQLTDRYVKYLIGVLKDAPIKAGYLYVLVDFVTLKMEEDRRTIIVLRRSLLAINGCYINVENGKLSFDVGLIMWNLIYLRLLNSLLFLMSLIRLM